MSGPRSEATKAIFAFIEQHQPVLQSVLHNHFRTEAHAAGVGVAKWLGSRLDGMAYARFIEHTSAGWVIAAGARAAKARLPGTAAPRRQAEAQPPGPFAIAQPRRVGMFGPAYVPPVVVHRPGADNHSAHPSVINGAPRPYRSGW